MSVFYWIVGAFTYFVAVYIFEASPIGALIGVVLSVGAISWQQHQDENRRLVRELEGRVSELEQHVARGQSDFRGRDGADRQ